MRHVLIVDDELDLGRLWQATITLLDSSMPVVVVPSAEEAMLEVARYPVDLLITDVRLPGMSGFDLVEKIRDDHKDMKIIMITGLPDDEYPSRAREIGVDEFFRKPMGIPALTAAVKRLLSLDPPAELPKEKLTISAEDKLTPEQILTAFLAEMRKKLGAAVVLILDAQSKVLSQAGYIPLENFQSDWIIPIMHVLQAGRKVSFLMKKEQPVSAQIFRGEKYDLAIAPIGKLGLVIFLEAGNSRLRLVIALEEILVEYENLRIALDESGLDYHLDQDLVFEGVAEILEGTQKDPPFEKVDNIAVDGSLESIFELLDRNQKPDLKDVESFWDQAIDVKELSSDDPDMLSYSQAQELGLISGEDG
ncbi:MAG: response regulator [Anaerolineaceae bacterium]|nr:response regulator [Anaerolineaceae bacterium]